MQHVIKYHHTSAQIFEFACSSEVKEYHIMIHAEDKSSDFLQQLEDILDAYTSIRKELPGNPEAVFKRYYLSDAANQADSIYALAAENSDCALSIIQQPPLDGTKVALWVYMQTNIQTRVTNSGLYEVSHGRYRHLWCGSCHKDATNSELQTSLILNDYIMQLAQEGCTLADNCLRTWFFVNDIDLNYGGIVRARNNVFFTQGLTSKTHFIASTGIGGRQENPHVLAQMDAYAVKGIQKQQIKYLYAKDHLSRTSDYGVSFERGTAVDYGDRRQVFISGTASINDKGEIMYQGDVRKQTERMLENIDALLKEALCTFDDVGEITVYLRDTADYETVRKIFAERFANKPQIIVLAPVCRSGWLIEMECMAVRNANNPQFEEY
jgi:enamine deaminase RidA (YjgF/YER057c/UK114 family)